MNRLFFLPTTGSRNAGGMFFALVLLFCVPLLMRGQPYQSWPVFPAGDAFPYTAPSPPSWTPSLHLYEKSDIKAPNIGMHWRMNAGSLLMGVTQWGIARQSGTYSLFATPGDVVLNASEGEDLIFTNLSGSKYSGTNNKGAIRFGTAQANGSGTVPADVERMTILHNGNVGINHTSPTAKLQVTDGAVLFNGTTGGTPVSGAGTRFMWIPGKAALRAGSVSGTEWNDANIGEGSVVLGASSEASGNYSFALGSTAVADGNNSIALGLGPNATGYISVAIGRDAQALGESSLSLSTRRATAESYMSVAVGSFNLLDAGYSPTSWVATDPMFIIGNGTSHSLRSNALTILKNGDVGIGDHEPAGTRLLVKSGGNTNATTALNVRNSDDDPLLFVQDDGKIGIGTDAPAALASLKSGGNTDATTALDVRNSDDDPLFFVRDDGKIGVGTSVPDALLSVTSTASSPSSAVSLFRIDNATAAEPLLVVREDGFVGIGNEPCSTDVADLKLKVNGHIKAKEIIVETTDWCDFVFEEGYELMPLELLEEKIEELGHLPNIPSAKDVEEKGVSVGEMQTKLLQKVEELTLYVIELKKENNELNERLKNVESEL